MRANCYGDIFLRIGGEWRREWQELQGGVQDVQHREVDSLAKFLSWALWLCAPIQWRGPRHLSPLQEISRSNSDSNKKYKPLGGEGTEQKSESEDIDLDHKSFICPLKCPSLSERTELELQYLVTKVCLQHYEHFQQAVNNYQLHINYKNYNLPSMLQVVFVGKDLIYYQTFKHYIVCSFQ